MAFANFTDANEWLDSVKVSFADANDAVNEASTATTIISGMLTDVFPDLIETWTTPETTPALVREAASLLMASYRYSKKYSQQTARRSSYSVQLEERAMKILTGLVDGTITLFDVDPIPVGASFGQADFYPNDTTGVVDTAEERMFTVRDEY